MDEEEKKTPEEGQSPEETPAVPDAGEEKKDEQEAPENKVPSKLEGKSSDDLVKMYGELERKLGAQGVELGQARQLQGQMQVVLQAIESNPQAKTIIEAEIAKISGKETEGKAEPNGQAKPDTGLRQVVEGQIIGQFETKNGLDTLDPAEKQTVYAKIGSELSEMLDPGGNKTQAEILASVDLTKLPAMLERAFYLANRDSEVEKATKTGMLRAQQNRGGMIGSIPSSGSVSQPGQALSAEEKEIARKLNMSDEEYTKNKNTPRGEQSEK